MLIHIVGPGPKDEILNYCRNSGLYRGGLRDINPLANPGRNSNKSGLWQTRRINQSEEGGVRVQLHCRTEGWLAVTDCCSLRYQKWNKFVSKFMTKFKLNSLWVSPSAKFYLLVFWFIHSLVCSNLARFKLTWDAGYE